MSNTRRDRSLLVALCAGLGLALLVIAFLLGRESVRRSETEVAALPTSPELEVETELPVQPTEDRRWPEWADLEEWEDVRDPQPVEVAPAVVRVEKRADGRVLLSNRRLEPVPAKPDTAPSPSSSASPSASAVVGYFAEMDRIRSQTRAGDPNAFAMGLIKAAMGGSTAGFDQLIADTERMEQEARAMNPPEVCAAYHEANLIALAESRAVLREMKSAIGKRDVSQLSLIAQKAGALELRAKALEEMRERMLAWAQR